jgi:hypothetical protein
MIYIFYYKNEFRITVKKVETTVLPYQTEQYGEVRSWSVVLVEELQRTVVGEVMVCRVSGRTAKDSGRYVRSWSVVLMEELRMTVDCNVMSY